MRTALLTLGVLAGLGLICMPVGATPGTLYDQEQGPNDEDKVEVDAKDKYPGTGDPHCENWKYQYGTYSWSGVYAGDSGWHTCPGSDEEGGDLKVEADVEMYCSETLENFNIYFHIGNIYNATASDLTAYVKGTMQSNNGQYVGLYLGPGKNVEKIGTAYTGKVIDGMQSDHDTWRPQDNKMDIEFALKVDDGPWQVPDNYGEGAHGTIVDTLWWGVAGGAPGSYELKWRVRILPEVDQPDGDYYLDPTFVVAPAL